MSTDVQPQRPNLLFFYSDQHNPAVTGCYGDPLVETPALDGLAARGVVFENAYCPSPLCVPSRMALLTGRHPYELGVWTNDDILSSAHPTFAHAMGAAGYWPVIIGRMHSVGPDQLHGYAERLVGDHGPNWTGGKPVDHGVLTRTNGPYRVSLEKSGSGQSAYQVHDEYVTAATVDYLNRLGVQKRTGLLTEPFNLSVGFMLPHQPFVAWPEDYARYWGRVGMPRTPEPFLDKLHPHFRWWREISGIEEVAEAEILRARTAYWALVSRLDAMIGEILAALRANGLAENTLIVYSSDHGEQLGEHGLWWKQTFYEDSARVPLILSWPGHLPEGVHSQHVVSQLDLTATLVDALGAPALPNARGRSLLPLLRDANAPWEDVAFSEYCTDEGCVQRMLRQGAWKLNYYHGQEPQLFNLAEDPYERHDRSQDPACRAVRAELVRRVLTAWDPVKIARTMQAQRADTELIIQWAQKIRPPDQYRWSLRPEMHRLDG